MDTETQFEELVETLKPVLSLDLEDYELIEQIDRNIDEAKEIWQEKTIDKGKKNYDYYLGNEDVKLGADQKTKIIENVIFRNTETIVPILTSSTPEPRVFHPNKKFVEKLRKILTIRWEVFDKMLEKSRITIRRNFFYYLGVMKVRFDEDLKDIVWETVKNDQVIVDPNGKFVAQIIDDMTLEEVIKLYPKNKDNLLKLVGVKDTDKKMLGSKISFIEYHTPEFTVWKYKSIILDKQKNPNWDWGETSEVNEMGIEENVAYNILKKPCYPYIFLKTFNINNEIYGDTSLIEQSIPLQDLINKRKKQIDDNADEANGSLVGSGDFISKEQFATIRGVARERIWVEKGDARSALVRMAGNPLQGYVQDDFIMTKSEIDNIMGTHATTRGAGSQSNTATEAVMEKQQDYRRIDDLIKAFEDFCEDYFNMTLQMMLIHYTEEHLLPIEGHDDVSLNRDMLIEELSKIYKYKDSELRGGKYEEASQYVKPIVMVKRGSTLPTDDVSKRNDAINLWGAGGIDPLSLYEELNDPNPELRAKRLFLWQQAPQILFPELAKVMGGGGQPTPQEQYTEGMIKDTEAIKNGEQPPINRELQEPETAQQHIQGHSVYMDSDEFQKLEPPVQQIYLNHVKEEVAFIKEQSARQEGQPTEQPMEQPNEVPPEIPAEVPAEVPPETSLPIQQ
jgi:hypothetical protein